MSLLRIPESWRPGPGDAVRTPSRAGRRCWPVLAVALILLIGGCVRRDQRSSGLIYPLTRHIPGDGLAVVTGPRGRGIHIWLDPDTSTDGVCRPRWNPDPARLENGGGMAPRSGGRAARQEFYDALRRGPVRLALRRQMRELCRRKAPNSRFVWREPPRSDQAFLPMMQPLWEEQHLLSNPTAVRRSEKQLLGQPLRPEDWDDRLPPRPPDGP